MGIFENWKDLFTLEFWQNLLESYKTLGPVAPIALAFLEAIFPPLPMVAIVLANVAAYGVKLGFLYSWIGSCLGCTFVFFLFRLLFRPLFAWMGKKSRKIDHARRWVKGVSVPTLFILIMLPFTPSSFVNFAFGVSDYSAPKYLITLYLAKTVMLALLAFVGESVVLSFKQPWMIAVSVAVLVLSYIISKKITSSKIADDAGKEE